MLSFKALHLIWVDLQKQMLSKKKAVEIYLQCDILLFYVYFYM